MPNTFKISILRYKCARRVEVVVFTKDLYMAISLMFIVIIFDVKLFQFVYSCFHYLVLKMVLLISVKT